ncbi:NAD-P-binding protein [Lenzites betulinus]|nr:NAD-P-binding protein [Lenzites betulinus]
MPSYAVIGASRGIGLEFIHQIAKKPDAVVFAVARDVNAPHLKAFAEDYKNVHVVQGDVAEHRSMARAADEVAALSGGTLDVLIHNAARMNSAQIFRGFDDYKDLDELDEDFRDAFNVNTLGVIHSITAFLPLLLLSTASTRKIAVISSGGALPARIVRTGEGDVVAYSTTKAAAVMVAAKFAARLASERFSIISLTPGVVDTSGTATATSERSFKDVADQLSRVGISTELLTPAQSVTAQLEVIDNLTAAQNGAVLSHEGDILQW